MGQIIKLEEKQKSVRQILLQSQDQICKALPKQVDKQRMFRTYLTAVQTSPKLLECDPMSLVGGVMQSAQFGLSLDTAMGEAYLIPRYNKNVRGKVANFQLGYKGLRKLALQGDPDLRDMYAQWVYQNDVFEYVMGEEVRIERHIPSEEENPGDLRLAYAVAVWKDSYKRIHVMLGRDIRKIRNTSDSYVRDMHEGTKDSPWNTSEQEMWRKTVLRALCGQMQLKTEDPLAAAMQAETIDGREYMAGQQAVPIVAEAEVTSTTTNGEPEPPKSALDAAVADAGVAPETETPAEQQAEDPPKASRKRRSN